MQKYFFIITLLTLVFSCKTESKKTEPVALKEEATEINLAEFDDKAGDFVNQEILVQGIVDHVCKHGGKKIVLATDGADIHVNAEERFDEALKGSKIHVTGIVIEDRIDEAYCLKMEEDNIKSHTEGLSTNDQFEAKKKHIQHYRDQMKADSINHISLYSLKYVSHTEVK